MKREFEKTPWWMKTDKYNQDKKIKEQEEKIRRLTGFMDVVKGDEVFNVFDELYFIKKYLEFFIENNLEGECVECESESLLEIRKRLEIVIEPYVEAACMEELDDQGDD